MITTKKIEYYVKGVYGHESCYIVDKHIAEVHTLLTGRKTLMSYDFEGYKELGFTFVEVLALRK